MPDPRRQDGWELHHSRHRLRLESSNLDFPELGTWSPGRQFFQAQPASPVWHQRRGLQRRRYSFRGNILGSLRRLHVPAQFRSRRSGVLQNEFPVSALPGFSLSLRLSLCRDARLSLSLSLPTPLFLSLSFSSCPPSRYCSRVRTRSRTRTCPGFHIHATHTHAHIALPISDRLGSPP